VVDVLLDNALHHGRGNARITVSDETTRVRICVEDDGPGISHELAGEVFERGSSESGGTGIGLHLAQVLARTEGGELRLAQASPPRFELALPRPRHDQPR
jgi:signal transduction histidine kinase